MFNYPHPKTIIEPFKIKMVEPIPILTSEKRRKAIREAHFNLFKLPAETVTFDLLTDSGTGAMSADQWSAMMVGDESYAGSKSFKKFEGTISDLTSCQHVIPTHQGRSAESLLFSVIVKPGTRVLGNTHFDTTRANIEAASAKAEDFPNPELAMSDREISFGGDIDLNKLMKVLKEDSSSVSLGIMTLTNNSVGGLPVSMSNLKAAYQAFREFKIPMIIDAARFAENAFFIKKREVEYSSKSVKQIAQEMFANCDGVVMSSKKDAFANIGGFVALKNEKVAEDIRTRMVLTEGFPTYGGLAGRDLEAIAVGLNEVLDENYLSYRTRSVAYFGEGLEKNGFQVVKPFGGHAVYINAGKTLKHLKAGEFPGQALSVALFEGIGIRGVEVGSVMLGSRDPKTGKEIPAPKELVRLAMPRRVYTQSHVDYMLELSKHLAAELDKIPGYEFTYQAPFLRHFSAQFRQKS